MIEEQELSTCEDSLDQLFRIVHPDVTDEIYIRGVYLARLLDTIKDLDEMKMLFLSKSIEFDQRIASLEWLMVNKFGR